jgi:hypothetical protein
MSTGHLQFGGVSAVAALSPTNVWAVGAGPGSSGDIPAALIEHWNGTSWSIVSTPSGPRSLAGMTALSGGTVIAAGLGFNNSAIILSN